MTSPHVGQLFSNRLRLASIRLSSACSSDKVEFLGSGWNRQMPSALPARIWEASMTELHPEIPRVYCPTCGEVLRLRRIVPVDEQSEMQFQCDCGFDYRMSTRARAELEA
jgi:predicted RNA-binding Zn-ribbon protein involved in translation (DUF1610 family)